MKLFFKHLGTEWQVSKFKINLKFLLNTLFGLNKNDYLSLTQIQIKFEIILGKRKFSKIVEIEIMFDFCWKTKYTKQDNIIMQIYINLRLATFIRREWNIKIIFKNNQAKDILCFRMLMTQFCDDLINSSLIATSDIGDIVLTELAIKIFIF